MAIDLEDIKRKIIDWARFKVAIRKVYVYGEMANPEHNTNSALELCLVIDDQPYIDSYALWIRYGSVWKRELGDILKLDIPLQIELLDTERNQTPAVSSRFDLGNLLAYDKNINF